MMPKIITETSESGAVRARYIISSSSPSSGSLGGGGGGGDDDGDGWRTDIVVRKPVVFFIFKVRSCYFYQAVRGIGLFY